MFLIIFIISVLIYLFISTKKEEVTKIKNQGGLYLKYKELIDFLLTFPNAEIEKKSSSSIALVAKGNISINRFTVAHGFEDVSILWSYYNPIYGEHHLNWGFNEYFPQSQMIDIIDRELGVYMTNLVSEGL